MQKLAEPISTAPGGILSSLPLDLCLDGFTMIYGGVVPYTSRENVRGDQSGTLRLWQAMASHGKPCARLRRQLFCLDGREGEPGALGLGAGAARMNKMRTRHTYATSSCKMD